MKINFKTRDEAIEKLKGEIVNGDCMYCGAKLAMEYTGDICFVCTSCGWSCHEDIYYQWAAGFDIEFE